MKTYVLPRTTASVHPLAERVESHRITLNGKRQTIHICAYGWETRNAWGHMAYCPELDISNKCRYYNRTWESYRFETAIKGCLHKCKMLDPNFRKRERAANRRIAKEAEALRKREEAKREAENA